MLTQEDYKKIEKYLQSKVQKDSEFNDAEIPLDGTELVTLVQKGFNKRLFIKDFIDQIFSLGIPDFINISDKYKETYKKAKKQYDNQLCFYNGETLTLSALSTRFRRMGIDHPTLEAKKYIKNNNHIEFYDVYP